MRRGLFTFVACTFVASCGGGATPQPKATEQTALLPDVRTADGRPPVVLVIREGDPAGAIGISVTTSGLTWSGGTSDDPEPAVALAGLIEGRLRAKSADVIVTPSYSGLRASLLVANEADATRLAAILRDVFAAPATEADLVHARRKLAALGQRPLPDRALSRWARCVGQPYSVGPRSEKEYAELDLGRLERWRAAGFGLGRVAVAVTAPPSFSDAVADSILRGPAWGRASALPQASPEASSPDVDVIEAPGGAASVALHLTLDVGTSSAAVTTAEALGDPHGPLAARLAELELPFRLREVTGAAHAAGGCVGVVLDASSSTAPVTDLATRVADATALVRLEAAVFLAERGAARDGRVLARRAGDARDAAERAAWWALVDQGPAPRTGKGSVVLSVPSRRKAKDDPLEPTRDALATAVARRATAWEQPVVEGRTRVEAGQGEAWVLVGSPCGTEAETENDSGLTAIFTTAAANTTTADVRVEPWVATDGAGLLVHGPALPGETPAAHARRLADTAARHFAAEPIPNTALGRARTDLLQNDARSDGSALSVLASALAPRHPSWVMPWGSSEPLARSSDAAVLLRAQALRSGPVRIAVLANVDATQGDAAVRAADRWVARRSADTRVCRAATAAEPPKPGTYAAPPRPGAIPEAYLAYPFTARDELAYDAANIVVAALAGSEGALLERAFGGSVSADASARVLGWPAAPALVVRVTSAQASLDSAVMQARALVDRLQKAGLPAADLDRALALRTRSNLIRSLDPRARVVDTWRAARPQATASRDDVRTYTQRHLGEESMIVVVSRPGRPPAAP